jgi:hypothetical protein
LPGEPTGALARSMKAAIFGSSAIETAQVQREQ